MIQRKPYEQDEKLREIADLCKRDLKFLCGQFLGKGSDPNNEGWTLWDRVHDDVEKMLKKPSQRKAIVLPRDHSKSTFVTVAYSIQQILKNPNIRILIANQIWEGARGFLSNIKQQLEQSQLKLIFGDFVSNTWNSDKIVVRQRTKPFSNATVSTTGSEAESTGGRFDLIIADDLMGEVNSTTKESRDKVKKFRRSLVNLLEPSGTMIDIATRWHLDDPIADILEKEREYYDIMIRRIVEDGKLIYPKKFSKKFDQVTKNFVSDPDGNSLDYVAHLKKTKPLDEFMSQYMNDPVSSENQIFRQDYFRYWNDKPFGMRVVMAVDLAISTDRTSDRTAFAVVGMDSERRIYVVDYLAGRWTPSEVVQNVFQMREKWGVAAVGMEVNGFQRMMKYAVEAEMRKQGKWFSIEEIRNGPSKSKEDRIKALEPAYRNGMIYHAAWMKGKDLEEELMTFPRARHDDISDVLAMSLGLLTPGASQPVGGVPRGSWEEAAQRARKAKSPWNGFFVGERRGKIYG